MIENLKWTGWVIALIILLFLIFQKSCSSRQQAVDRMIHDTILIKGDSTLKLVQDTILQPVKMVYISKNEIADIDTEAVIKDYFAERTYLDTVKSRDIVAVIKDSIKNNKLVGRKILLENSRNKQLIGSIPEPVEKFFCGGFVGLSQMGFKPAAGISIYLITKKEMLYCYHYDAIGKVHTLGINWRLKF